VLYEVTTDEAGGTGYEDPHNDVRLRWAFAGRRARR
jgi:hypothetical protein